MINEKIKISLILVFVLIILGVLEFQIISLRKGSQQNDKGANTKANAEVKIVTSLSELPMVTGKVKQINGNKITIEREKGEEFVANFNAAGEVLKIEKAVDKAGVVENSKAAFSDIRVGDKVAARNNGAKDEKKEFSSNKIIILIGL